MKFGVRTFDRGLPAAHTGVDREDGVFGQVLAYLMPASSAAFVHLPFFFFAWVSNPLQSFQLHSNSNKS